MDKSYNDIMEQERRVMALAERLGAFCNTKDGSVDKQRIAQIARRALCQHGISLFGYNPDEKKPYRPTAEPAKPQHKAVAEQPLLAPAPKHPTQPVRSGEKLFDWMSNDVANRKKVTDMARHEFINKMYAEVLFDMTVCQIEGWDVSEFPRMLRKAIDYCNRTLNGEEL